MPFPLRTEPRVSILIPARNEAAILTKTLPAFMEQDYGNYEVILVDDASTDGTGNLGRSFEAKYPGRLRVIRIEELPPGWVGKTHALQKGFEAASGEWVLATDADIVFHPKALRAGLWLAQRQVAELVSLFAFLECGSFWERLMMPVFGLMLATVFPVRKINNPQSSVAIASGGYILMRRETWSGLGGYEAIRGEMIDDLNTARHVKHSGRRIFAALTPDLVRTRMYANLAEIWEGLRKNAFAAHRFSVFRMLAFVVGAWFTALLPLAALAYSVFLLLMAGSEFPPGVGVGVWMIFAMSLAQYAISVWLHFLLIRFYGIPWGYALLAPCGSLLYTAIAFDSMLRTLFGAGVSWKLRQYGKPLRGAETQLPTGE
jgi:hopene-associated glycosyltransferase HpnB